MNDHNSQSKNKSRFVNEAISFIQVIIIALIIRALILELFFIPSGSMKLNLLEGDYIFATKYSYGFSRYSLPFSPNLFSGRIFGTEPKLGDIIILKPPRHQHDRFIKRLIGLPGDKIQVINDVIHINDVPIRREALGTEMSNHGEKYLKFKETLPEGTSFYSYKLDRAQDLMDYKSNTQAFYVPKEQYFFMGDNRDNSDDSRYSLGYVPFENLIAKARFIIFSADETLFSQIEDMKHGNPWSWLKSIRINRIFSKIYL